MGKWDEEVIAMYPPAINSTEPPLTPEQRFQEEYNKKLTPVTVTFPPNKPTDPVDHPTHYSRWKMEPIEYIMINDLPAWHANVVKYCARWDAKDGLKDLYKARSYLDMKIRQLEGTVRFWEKPVAEERTLNGKSI